MITSSPRFQERASRFLGVMEAGNAGRQVQRAAGLSLFSALPSAFDGSRLMRAQIYSQMSWNIQV